MFEEFKKFILRGNVIDLATGVIIGAAFGKIVNSMVNDIIMPPLGLIINNVNFKDLKLVIGGTPQAPVTINYGNFIQDLIEFMIIAFCIFLIVKIANTIQRKTDEKPITPPAPSKEEQLLTEIRDLLKK